MDKKVSTPFIFLWAALIGALYIDGVAGAWDTCLDNEFEYTCCQGQVLYRLSSQHSNFREDRQWKFNCRDAAEDANPTDCYWTNYVNYWDAPISFECKPNYAIAGISSYHDNVREDRRYKFKCCKDDSFKTSSCHLTPYQNTYDNFLNFTVPNGSVITGVNSVHDNHSEDRIFRFNVCKYDRS